MASLEEITEDLRGRYESLLEWLAEHNVPRPELLVPAVVLILLIGVAWLLFFGAAAPSSQTVSISVQSSDGTPISGARVSLLHADTSILLGTGVTGPNGTALVENIPTDAPLRVSVQATSYQPGSTTLGPGVKATSITLQPETAAAAQQLRVLLRDSEGNPVEGAAVKILFDDGTQEELPSNTFGAADFDVSELPGHATVYIQKDGFADVMRGFQGADLEGQVTIQLESQESKLDPTDVGLLLVRVTTVAKAPIQNVVVSLMDAVTGESVLESRTWQDGTASFPEIPYNKQVFVLVNDPDYRYLSATGEPFEFTQGLEPVIVRLQAATSGNQGEVTVVALDEVGKPLEGAEVKLYDRSSNQLLLGPFTTDERGEVRARATNGITFYATLYMAGYLPGLAKTVTTGEVSRVTLETETEENAFDAIVEVKENEEASAGATVVARKSDGFFLGTPAATTGVDGLAKIRIPRRMEGADYRLLFAASREHSSGETDVVSSKPPLNASIVLTPAKATLLVTTQDVLNDQKLNGVSITALSGTTTVGTCSTGTSGSCLLTLPAGDVTLVASVAGYLQTTSSPITLAPASKSVKKLLLYSGALAKSAYVRFDGLYNAQGRVLEVGTAERYRARFFVTMPPGVSQSGFYVRVGTRATASSDLAGIASFDTSGAASIYSSPTYSPDEGCASDNATSNSSALLKWVEFRFPKGFTGTKEFTVEVQMARELNTGENELEFSYRAFALLQGVPVLFPTDAPLVDKLTEKLAAGEFLKPADFCQAGVTKTKVPVSADPMVCVEEGVCARFVFENPTTGERGREGFELSAGKDFLLRFDILPDFDVTSIGLRGEQVKLEGVEKARASFQEAGAEQRFAFTAKAGEKTSGVLRGTALQNSRAANLQFVIHPKTEGDEPVVIPLVVAITGGNRLKASAVPATIDALSEQRVTVQVLTSVNQPVEDASVELYSCRGNPLLETVSMEGSGEPGAGEDGKYTFNLEAQGPGRLCVRASKEGYKALDQALITVISTDYLEVSPESISIDESNKAQAQRVTVRNLLDSKVPITGSIMCDAGGSGILQVFPKSASATAGGDAAFDIKVVKNVSSQAICRARFTSSVGTNNYAEAEVSITLSVAGAPSVPVGKEIPSPLYLYLDEYTPFSEKYAAAYQGQRVTTVAVEGTTGSFGGIQQLVYATLDSTAGTIAMSAQYDPSLFGGYGMQAGQASNQYSYSYMQGYGYPQIGNPGYYGGSYPTYHQPVGGAGIGFGGAAPYGSGFGAGVYAGFQNLPVTPGFSAPGFPMRGTIKLTLANGQQVSLPVVVTSRPNFGMQQTMYQGQQSTVLPTTLRFTVVKRGTRFEGTSEVTYLALPTGYSASANEFLFTGPVPQESVQSFQGYGSYQGQYQPQTNYYSDISFSVSAQERAGKIVLVATFNDIRGDDPRSRLAGVQAYVRIALKSDPSRYYLVPIAFDDVVKAGGLYFDTKKETLTLEPGQEGTWDLALKRDGAETERLSGVPVELVVSKPELGTVRNPRTRASDATDFAEVTSDSRGRVSVKVTAKAAGAFDITATALDENEPSAVLQVIVKGTSTQGQGVTSTGVKAELVVPLPECELGQSCQLPFKFTQANGLPLANSGVTLTIDATSPLSFYQGSGQTSKSTQAATGPDGIARFDIVIPELAEGQEDVSLDVFSFDVLPAPPATATQAGSGKLSLQGGRVQVPAGARITGAPRLKVKRPAKAAATLEFQRGGCDTLQKAASGWTCAISGEYVFFDVKATGTAAKDKSVEFRSRNIPLSSGGFGSTGAYGLRALVPLTPSVNTATVWARVPLGTTAGELTATLVDVNGQPVAGVPAAKLFVTRSGGLQGTVGELSSPAAFDTSEGLKLDKTSVTEGGSVTLTANLQAVGSNDAAKIFVFYVPYSSSGISEESWLSDATYAVAVGSLTAGKQYGSLYYACQAQATYVNGMAKPSCTWENVPAGEWAVLVLAYGMKGSERDELTPAVRFVRSAGTVQKVSSAIAAGSLAGKITFTEDESKGLLRSTDGKPVLLVNAASSFVLKADAGLAACNYALQPDVRPNHGRVTGTISGTTLTLTLNQTRIGWESVDELTLFFRSSNADCPSFEYPVRLKYSVPVSAKAAAQNCELSDWRKVAYRSSFITDEEYLCLKAGESASESLLTLDTVTPSLIFLNSSIGRYPLAVSSSFAKLAGIDLTLQKITVDNYALFRVNKWFEATRPPLRLYVTFEPVFVRLVSGAPSSWIKYQTTFLQLAWDGKELTKTAWKGSIPSSMKTNFADCGNNVAWAQVYADGQSGILSSADLKELCTDEKLAALQAKGESQVATTGAGDVVKVTIRGIGGIDQDADSSDFEFSDTFRAGTYSVEAPVEALDSIRTITVTGASKPIYTGGTHGNPLYIGSGVCIIRFASDSATGPWIENDYLTYAQMESTMERQAGTYGYDFASYDYGDIGCDTSGYNPADYPVYYDEVDSITQIMIEVNGQRCGSYHRFYHKGNTYYDSGVSVNTPSQAKIVPRAGTEVSCALGGYAVTFKLTFHGAATPPIIKYTLSVKRS